MHRLTSLVFATALVLAPGGAFAQSGVAGNWDVTFDTPQGPQTVTVTVKLDGDKATGQLTTPVGSVPVTGTAGANDFDLTATVDIQGATFQLGLKGKVDGDTLAGSVKAGDVGEFPFRGKRSAAPGQPAAAVGSASAPSPAPAGSATAFDATGKWNIVLTIGANQIPATATLKQDGEKISGVVTNPIGETPVSGTMSGGTLKLEFTAQTPQGPLPITMTGTLGAEGLAGKMTVAGMGEADWTGKRAN
jgi:hypothetical protein